MHQLASASWYTMGPHLGDSIVQKIMGAWASIWHSMVCLIWYQLQMLLLIGKQMVVFSRLEHCGIKH